MSRSYWLPVLAAIGWLIAGSALGANGDPQPPKATADQPAPNNAASGNPPAATIDAQAAKPSGGETEDQRAKERQEARELADLAAQERMADAAEKMVWLTIAQAFIGMFTVGLLVWTVRETKRTADAGIESAKSSIRSANAAEESAKIADTAMRNLDRAYLFAGPDDIRFEHAYRVTHFSLMIHNYGKTPAFFKEVVAEFADELPGDEPVYGTNKEEYWVGKIDAVIGADSPYRGEGNEYRFRGDGPRFFFGYVKYEDVFKTTHTSRFCCLILGGKTRVAGAPAWNEWD